MRHFYNAEMSDTASPADTPMTEGAAPPTMQSWLMAATQMNPARLVPDRCGWLQTRKTKERERGENAAGRGCEICKQFALSICKDRC
jgi:hypothetical protein